jgi:hypothetical protein
MKLFCNVWTYSTGVIECWTILLLIENSIKFEISNSTSSVTSSYLGQQNMPH